MPGLLAAERQEVSANAELNRIAHGSPADTLDRDPTAQTHLQQPPSDIGITINGYHLAAAADTQRSKRTGAFALTLTGDRWRLGHRSPEGL